LNITNIVDRDRIILNGDISDEYSQIAVPSASITEAIMTGYNRIAIEGFYQQAGIQSGIYFSTVFDDSNTVLDIPDLVNTVTSKIGRSVNLMVDKLMVKLFDVNIHVISNNGDDTVRFNLLVCDPANHLVIVSCLSEFVTYKEISMIESLKGR
jgi:hypothetical protein